MGSDQIQMSKSKFKEYYALNLRFISPVIFVLSLVMGIAGGLLTGRWISFRWFVIFIWAICVPDIVKVCSKTLYQKEAYFYQSFPVTPFQTVLAKTLVCAQLLQMGPFAFLAVEKSLPAVWPGNGRAACHAAGIYRCGIILNADFGDNTSGL